jgi:hypothetical protein
MGKEIKRKGLETVIGRFLDKTLRLPEYKWIKKIDIKVGSTLDSGWVYDAILVKYVVYITKDGDYDSQQSFYDKLGYLHNMIEPNRVFDETSIFWSISAVLPNGKESSFPTWDRN